MPKTVSLAVCLGSWLKRNAENVSIFFLLVAFGLKGHLLRWVEIRFQGYEADLQLKLAIVRTQRAKARLIESKAKQLRQR